MTTIFQVINSEDFDSVHDLLYEYLSWISQQAKNLHEVDIDVNRMLDYYSSST